MTTGMRRDQMRGFDQRPPAAGSITTTEIADGTLLPADFNSSVYGGVPTTIDPDDASAAGVATTVSRSDHQHQATTGTPASVGTANAEGAGTGFARDTHVHDIANGAIDAAALFGAGVVNNAALGAGAVTPAKVTVNYARVARAATQAITTATATNIIWDTEMDDPGGFWVVGNPTQLVVVTAGVVQVNANSAWDVSPTGQRRLIIVLNALTTVAGQTEAAVATSLDHHQSANSGPIRVAVNDVFTFSVYQNTGGNLNLTAGTNATIEWLGV